jgi:hypothetical protein
MEGSFRWSAALSIPVIYHSLTMLSPIWSLDPQKSAEIAGKLAVSRRVWSGNELFIV